ncbi:MAG: hypothetical protein U1E76_18890 [Planctomycetota bacterium]
MSAATSSSSPAPAQKLTSGTLNLQDYVGLQVEAKGNWNGLVTTPTVDVTAAAVVARTFEVGGNGKIGGDLIFAVTSTPGDFTVMLLALGRASSHPRSAACSSWIHVPCSRSARASCQAQGRSRSR